MINKAYENLEAFINKINNIQNFIRVTRSYSDKHNLNKKESC